MATVGPKKVDLKQIHRFNLNAALSMTGEGNGSHFNSFWYHNRL